jgi:hypothetical protein
VEAEFQDKPNLLNQMTVLLHYDGQELEAEVNGWTQLRMRMANIAKQGPGIEGHHVVGERARYNAQGVERTHQPRDLQPANQESMTTSRRSRNSMHLAWLMRQQLKAGVFHPRSQNIRMAISRRSSRTRLHQKLNDTKQEARTSEDTLQKIAGHELRMTLAGYGVAMVTDADGNIGRLRFQDHILIYAAMEDGIRKINEPRTTGAAPARPATPLAPGTTEIDFLMTLAKKEPY